jgi:hypothetical protein
MIKKGNVVDCSLLISSYPRYKGSYDGLWLVISTLYKGTILRLQSLTTNFVTEIDITWCKCIAPAGGRQFVDKIESHKNDKI